MANTLDLTGLNGLLIDPQQLDYVASATKGADGTFTVSSTGNNDATVSFLSGKPSLPIQINVGHQPSPTPPSFNVTLNAVQPGNGNFNAGDFPVKVLGWNADSILIEAENVPSFFQFEVITATDSASGTPDDLVFGTTGPAPTIDGITPTIITCFAAGTRIMTCDGPAAVENLQVGDLLQTISGALQPIVWVGVRTVRCTGHAQPARVMPVRVAADAFGPGLPSSDLYLSPEHAVFAEGVMIPVHALVNGATIRQVAVEQVSYYHVELPQHDVLLAEGLPAESYLDTGNRHALVRHDRIAHAA
jgi:hypothetical protein